MLAAQSFGTPDTVRILLEHGADINTKDKSGKLNTNIYLCVYNSHNHTQNNKIYSKSNLN